jgi:protein-S-isoprenylcysteine O-methyltransferase Ste14
MADDGKDNPGIRVPPPPLYVLALLLGLVLDRKVHVPFLPRRVARVLGLPLVGGGMALAAWFVFTMRGGHTTIRIDKPVSSLVQDGPFRYTRNPGYVALTLIYAGIATLRNALWAILLLPLVLYVIERMVIEREERYLERTFGEEYLTYKARVRRWM